MADFASFALFLERSVEHMARGRHRDMQRIGNIVLQKAQSKPGHYQSASGPFHEWKPLSDSTKEDRVRQGFSADEPLLRTGELRDSYQVATELHSMTAGTVHIGSDLPKAVGNELGTLISPPRPVLGPALLESIPEIQKTVVDSVHASFDFKNTTAALESPIKTVFAQVVKDMSGEGE